MDGVVNTDMRTLGVVEMTVVVEMTDEVNADIL